MGTFTAWVRARKPVASAVALAVAVGVPVTFAVLHQGFPVTDPDLRVTDTRLLAAGSSPMISASVQCATKKAMMTVTGNAPARLGGQFQMTRRP